MQPVKPNYSKEQKKKGRGCGVLILIMLLVLVTAVGIAFFIKNQYDASLSEPLTDSDQIITFEINEGEGVDAIISNLGSEGILDDNQEKYFKFYLTINDLGSSIQAGSFQIPLNLTIVELAKSLQTAGIPEVWITFPEGMRVDEYGVLLEDQFGSLEETSFSIDTFLILNEDEDLIASLDLNGSPETLEGFLFPDRYLIPLTSTEEELIQMFVENFKDKTDDDYTYQDIIIASMLEREGRQKDEKKMIADIINRRLAEGWFLGIDATLLYHYKDWEWELTDKEINEDHPYNTRIRIGLPPTPIGNPGLESIDAAQNPTSNQYYYYLHDSDGKIHYAKTIEEHNQNIQTYLR